LFYVLASSIRLAFPLPEHLPNALRARDRLLAKLFDYRVRVRGTEGEVDEDFAMVYAYGKFECVEMGERRLTTGSFGYR
jgi:hypothetical protein